MDTNTRVRATHHLVSHQGLWLSPHCRRCSPAAYSPAMALPSCSRHTESGQAVRAGGCGELGATHQLRACCHGAVPPGQVALPAPTGPQSRRSTHRHHAQLSVPQQPQPRVVEVLRLQEGWVMGTLCQDPGSRSHRGRGTHSNGTACSVRHLTLLLASQACRAREVFCAAMQRAVATFTSWKTAPTCTLRHQLSQRA